MNRHQPHRIVDNWRRVSMRCRRLGIKLTDEQARSVSRRVSNGMTLGFAIQMAKL